jgi:prevent-host-death family protein
MNRPARRKTLSLQDAKARFSEVVDAAMRGEPQHVTRRGKPAVVIVDASEFVRLAGVDPQAPPGFIEHLLSIPKTPAGQRRAVGSRLQAGLRDIDFSP